VSLNRIHREQMAIGQEHALKSLNLDKIRLTFARKESENNFASRKMSHTSS